MDSVLDSRISSGARDVSLNYDRHTAALGAGILGPSSFAKRIPPSKNLAGDGSASTNTYFNKL